VVDADTLNTFKNRLDKHWLDQDVLYNFHPELTGKPEVLQVVCDVVKDTGEEEYPRPFIRIGLDWIRYSVLVISIFNILCWCSKQRNN